MPSRAVLVRLALVLAAGALALVVVPGRAAAAKPCWQQVIDDWHDNGRIDRNYPIRCYRDALKHVPEDERDYTSIVDDINAKMQVSSRGTHQVGSPPGSGHNGGSGGGSNGSDGGSGGNAPKQDTHGSAPSQGSFKKASAKLDSSNSNSLPLPLILLGSLALLLLGAAAGMRLYRFVQERRNGLRPAPARKP
jgi:hypothetical protein